jgi:tRNA(Glu) U13 pseudouridine synthase TruD
MKRENLNTKDFRIDSLKISCSGGKRQTFVRPKIENVDAEDNNVKIKFILPKGSYATVLIRKLSG